MSEFEFMEEPETCKGLYWRGILNDFISAHGSIESRVSLRLLKRMSCEGCSCCGWVLDAMKDAFPALPEVVGGKIYTYHLHTSRGWEDTYDDLDYVEIVEIHE